ncbi:MAG: glycosyltransferase family 2 protein [Chloroflexi bacterium]|nr:glycosyltransferase family 2 protein [Chloroflexota bacterium]
MVDLSICIVNYKAKELLRECLKSIYQNTNEIQLEIILVDNNSQDSTIDMVSQNFSTVRLVVNQENVGFVKATNQALTISRGRYALWLNPDTIVLPNALDTLVKLMDTRPDIGIVGPKVLNRDGTLQQQCRRGFPTPWRIFCYFSGLSELFPKSKIFAGYLMTYLEDEVANEVDAVSGSCLLVRREVMDQVGLIDEDYFMYGDDLDYCFRAKQAGWKIYYMPEARIIHYGGSAAKRKPYKAIYEFHRAMWIYYRKHLAQNYFFPLNWLVYGAILIGGGFSFLTNLFRKEKVPGSIKP